MKRTPLVRWLPLLVVALGCALVLHELGHHLADMYFGRRLLWVRVFPGMQLYPTVELIGWRWYVASLGHADIPGAHADDWRYGVCAFAGAAATALTAIVLLAGMYLLRPGRRAASVLALFIAVFGQDIVTYSTLPLFGLRHFVVVGGDYPEPYWGATRLGVPAVAYFAALAAYAVLLAGLLYYYFRGARPALSRPSSEAQG